MDTMSWSWSEYFPVPDYFRLFRMVLEELPEYYRTLPSNGTLDELTKYSYVTWSEIQLGVLMAVIWTLIRTLLTVLIFKVSKPD